MAGSVLGYSFFWVLVLIFGTIAYFLHPWSIAGWAFFWNIVGIYVPVVVAFVIGVWFTWGGVRDIRTLFRRLRAEKVNHLDDGTVVNHQNLVDVGTLPVEPGRK